MLPFFLSLTWLNINSMDSRKLLSVNPILLHTSWVKQRPNFSFCKLTGICKKRFATWLKSSAAPILCVIEINKSLLPLDVWSRRLGTPVIFVESSKFSIRSVHLECLTTTTLGLSSRAFLRASDLANEASTRFWTASSSKDPSDGGFLRKSSRVLLRGLFLKNQ